MIMESRLFFLDLIPGAEPTRNETITCLRCLTDINNLSGFSQFSPYLVLTE